LVDLLMERFMADEQAGSHKAKQFLEQWVLENVHTTVPVDNRLEAMQLALRCLKDAERHGITRAELEAAAGQDLVHSMLDAQKASAEARIGDILGKGV
jgi:hypothetical protein